MSDHLLESFKTRYSFPLDPFQLDAIRAISDDKSVIVSAPTGSGQDAGGGVRHPRRPRPPAPHRLHHAAQGALQPEVRRLLPAVRRGRRRHPHRRRQGQPARPVIVMTTEILRNMFYTGGLAGLEFVVLDECHYMGDEGAARCGKRSSSTRPRTWRWWGSPPPSGTSTRSPTGSASSTAPSCPSRIRTAACPSST